MGVEEDDDAYEPDFYVAEDTEQILNKLDNAPPEVPPEQNAEPDSALALGPFRLPPPPVLNPESAARVSQVTAMRIFGPLSGLEDPLVKKQKTGLNRLAANSHDRDSWLTLITRLATRSTVGLDDGIKTEADATALGRPQMSLSNLIREMLFNYVLEDWRRRIDVAIAWCNEEWYNDKVAEREGLGAPRNYEQCALRLMDGFLSYTTGQDKGITRFLSEIPQLSRELLGRVKALCSDPATVHLAMTSLLYVVMFKPPAREMALDTVYEIWLECKFCLFRSCCMIRLLTYFLFSYFQMRMRVLWQKNTFISGGQDSPMPMLPLTTALVVMVLRKSLHEPSDAFAASCIHIKIFKKKHRAAHCFQNIVRDIAWT